MVLASSAFSDEVFGVLVHGWPKESALPDLGLSMVYTIVSPMWCRMTFLNNSHSFSCGYTSSQQAISTNSVEVRIIPQVASTFVDQLLLIFPCWYISCNHKIHNIWYQGVTSVTLKSMSSRRKSFIGSSCMLVKCIRDKWSATEFSTSFLSFYLYLWSRRDSTLFSGILEPSSYTIKKEGRGWENT